MKKHLSHVTRFSFGASTYDEICELCGATDESGDGWGKLSKPCKHSKKCKEENKEGRS